MNILILGGTRFFGKETVSELLRRGHQVTIGTRGMTADSFGDQVGRIVLDRSERTSIQQALGGKHFDVVFDNICYAPDDVIHLLATMEGQIGKYIVTSSLAVYDKGLNLTEESFDPYHYPIKYGTRQDYTYSEGKRLVEAVIYQQYEIPTIAVRFPVVIGKDDYTQRLHFYVEQIVKEVPFAAIGKSDPMCFVSQEEAALALADLVESEFVGPINIASTGTITVEEIIGMIEVQTGKDAQIREACALMGPYSTFGNVTLDLTRAEGLGIKGRSVESAFEEMITYALCQLKH